MFIFTLLMICFVTVNASGYSKTGYNNFKDISFVEEGKLLFNMDQSEINSGYKKMGKRRFWGWKTHYFFLNAKVDFVGEQIFSRSNKTTIPVDFDYYIKEVKLSERTRKSTGSIGAKTKGSISKFDLNLDAELKGEVGTKESTTVTEEMKIKLQIMPNTRITLRTVGEAYVSNGVACYYILGITFKKGAWEIIDIDTLYYEIIEENL